MFSVRPSPDAGRGLNIHSSPSYTLKPNTTVDPKCILNLSMKYNYYCIIITRNIYEFLKLKSYLPVNSTELYKTFCVIFNFKM